MQGVIHMTLMCCTAVVLGILECVEIYTCDLVRGGRREVGSSGGKISLQQAANQSPCRSAWRAGLYRTLIRQTLTRTVAHEWQNALEREIYATGSLPSMFTENDGDLIREYILLFRSTIRRLVISGATVILRNA